MQIGAFYPNVPFIASALSLRESIASSKSKHDSPVFSGSLSEQRPSFQFMQVFLSQKG
jgi:hypothetical protein